MALSRIYGGGFTYSSESLLLTGPGSTSLAYDPLMRLHQVTSGSATKLAYDGLDRIAEYDAGNALLRRYVHGPGTDQPIVWYEGSGTSDRRFLSADERGSIISVTDTTGALLGINSYDEYGNPGAANLGDWGYTGQAWLPSLGAWHYKARAYDPELGRFLQTDPIGYEDSPSLYAYVGNDPVNNVDPLGLWRLGGVYSFGSLTKADGASSGGGLGWGSRFQWCQVYDSPWGACPSNPGWSITSYSGIGRPTGSYAFAEPEAGGVGGGTSVPPPAPPPANSPPPPARRPSKPTNHQCNAIATAVSEGAYGFGTNLTNFSSGVIAAGLIGKSPHIVAGGEILALAGTGIQALGAAGRLAATGNLTRARYDAIGIAFSFFQSQTKAGSLALGVTGGTATDLASQRTPGLDCAR